MIGVGAVGSFMSEMLVRGGAQKLVVVDKDQLTAGNLVRHTLLIDNLGDLKARSVAERLKRASPHAVVESMDCSISSLSSEDWANLARCDLLIDCTGSDENCFITWRGGGIKGLLFCFNRFWGASSFCIHRPWLRISPRGFSPVNSALA